jgi:hypothetical protein|tara:strand:+ start:291 stop:1166 length:876 start_codon:yes stop_codon:yes gene_type:complete
MKLIDLDECVLNALELFQKTKLPKLKHNFKRPLVVGSMNAALTGQIIMQDTDAVFADEGTFEEKLNTVKGIDGCLLLSASGKKHAPVIAKAVKKRGIKVILITNNDTAPAKAIAHETIILPKNVEPFTYNTSTYMGMILTKTKEDPKKILAHINKIKNKIPNMKKYKAFYLIIPEEFPSIRDMFLTKFDELFGPMLTCRCWSYETTKHAKTVIPWDKELFISFGHENKIFGKNRYNVPLPKGASYATLMAVGYYVIGQIQKDNPAYFKKNIVAFTKAASKLFGSDIQPIVK